MRWIHIDRITEIQTGKSCKAVKNVSLGEDYLSDHFPSYPVRPPSLIIEGMAQTGGILVGHAQGFREKIILAKIQKASFYRSVMPGDQITFEARVEEMHAEGSRITGKAWVAEELMADIALMYVNLKRGQALASDNFVFTWEFLSLLKLHEVTPLEKMLGK
jgi:3-hydroxyacyl-[acyl-carrier-protein] dehydratase